MPKTTASSANGPSLVAGIDLGGTAVNVTLLDQNGEFLIDDLCEHPARSVEGPQVCLQQIAAGLDQALDRAGASRGDLAAVGLDTPGPASAAGVLSRRGSTNFVHSNWAGYDVRAGLEALAVYANHHPKARDLLGDFSMDELVLFKLKDSSLLGWLRRSSRDGFLAGTCDPPGKPSVTLSFSGMEVAFDAVKEGIDPLGAPATGELEIRGKIHLMDRIGYVGRMAMREVPIPK